ncbi:hypothetical protein B0J13DRAFT_564257 [Dactylonectria estremocensis]|uniref:FAD/NAD(P)-binding domain-containing protein n=1 Tax=Dactylonectria estremocensis TaxID=1079267 RepID=A0A9P9INW6_9HYPO|nr:hypothetical protein B0J13DRAFT_564257 [Dactylonectria estremocensis]
MTVAKNNIVIIGAGFAGLWSALSAKRLINLKHKEKDIEVVVIAPEPSLVVRPRLYEANPSSMAHPLASLFEDSGIKFIQGTVETIHMDEHTVDARSPAGTKSTISYSRLVLAAGSTLVRPETVTGLQQYGFDIDSLDSATKLDSHLERLASLPASQARNTVVVCGGGFTGIEIATELPGRLGQNTNLRVIVVENAAEVGPELGPGPRPVILQALKDLGVEVKLGSAVAEIDAEGVTLSSGERIETNTAIWTAGVRATALTQQIPGTKDRLSRLHVDQDLRIPSSKHVFATGDAAHVLLDTKGHHATMSCQHAMLLGRVSGYNAAADLLSEPTMPYSQPAYGCCLDLGAWGAVITRGWDREVKVTGATAKKAKTYINQTLIYPPQSAEQAMAESDPLLYPDGDAFFDQMLPTIM